VNLTSPGRSNPQYRYYEKVELWLITDVKNPTLKTKNIDTISKIVKNSNRIFSQKLNTIYRSVNKFSYQQSGLIRSVSSMAHGKKVSSIRTPRLIL